MNKNKKNIRDLIKNANYVMVDSLDALEYCKNNGLSSFTKIISFNPYLVLGVNENIESPEKDFSTNYYKKLSDITKVFTKKIHKIVYNYSKDNSLAVYCAYYIILIQNLIHKTNLVTNHIKNSNLVAIYPDYSQEGLNDKINANFYHLLESYKNVTTIKLKYNEIDQLQMGRDPVSNFWVRLNFEGLNSILFRIFVIISSKLNFLWTGKRILFSHENTLLKGTASYLFRKKFFIKKLSGSINYENLYNKTILNEVYMLVKPLINEYQENIYLQKNNYNQSYIENNFKKYISDYFNAKDYWKNYYLNNSNNKKIAACLIGTPRSALELSCIEVSKDFGVLTASFQHGISKEINDDLLSIDVTYESSLVDHFFVFNKKASEDSRGNRFNISKEYVVGLPEDMKIGLKKEKFKYSKQSILYVSTTLYSGNRGIPSRSGNSDLNKANFEINLINNVFSKISSEIHYKPYYSKRFPGPSVEIELAKLKKNIYINSNEEDLRYIVGNFKVIITSRATSTIGWCMLSGKPVIYIENEDNRLKKKIVKEFKKSLFYFDVLDKGWDQNLYNLLEQPINIIEEQWKLKQSFQEGFLENYFGSEKTNAEKKCADILLNKILNTRI